MPAEETTTTAETAPVVEETAAGQSTAGVEPEAEKVPGEEALGDPGKKALDTMKAERQAAKEDARKEKARADALQAKLDGREAEFTAEQERRRVEDAALAKANGRIVRSEMKAAAKGVLADPADAFKFIDLDQFEVDNDGNVDEAAIAAAIAQLVKDKPYLAAQGGKRFQGDADGGARKDAGPTQLTQADLDRMYAAGQVDEIAQAKREHRFDQVLGIKP